jgi:uncharacterized protein
METIGTRDINGYRLAYALHDAGSMRLVIMCHGFRSSMIGPNRLFVRVARELAAHGISSLRFDQYGSGNSEGDFVDSSFDGWIRAIVTLANEHIAAGHRVALLGQSMGGSAAICVAEELGARLSGIAAWVPGTNVIANRYAGPDLMEEGGQVVRTSFWQEAHDADVAGALARITAPTRVWLATQDEFCSPDDNQRLVDVAQPHQAITILDGYPHSAWTFAQSEQVVQETVDFLLTALGDEEVVSRSPISGFPTVHVDRTLTVEDVKALEDD